MSFVRREGHGERGDVDGKEERRGRERGLTWCVTRTRVLPARAAVGPARQARNKCSPTWASTAAREGWRRIRGGGTEGYSITEE